MQLTKDLVLCLMPFIEGDERDMMAFEEAMDCPEWTNEFMYYYWLKNYGKFPEHVEAADKYLLEDKFPIRVEDGLAPFWDFVNGRAEYVVAGGYVTSMDEGRIFFPDSDVDVFVNHVGTGVEDLVHFLRETYDIELYTKHSASHLTVKIRCGRAIQIIRHIFGHVMDILFSFDSGYCRNGIYMGHTYTTFDAQWSKKTGKTLFVHTYRKSRIEKAARYGIIPFNSFASYLEEPIRISIPFEHYQSTKELIKSMNGHPYKNKSTQIELTTANFHSDILPRFAMQDYFTARDRKPDLVDVKECYLMTFSEKLRGEYISYNAFISIERRYRLFYEVHGNFNGEHYFLVPSDHSFMTILRDQLKKIFPLVSNNMGLFSDRISVNTAKFVGNRIIYDAYHGNEPNITNTLFKIFIHKTSPEKINHCLFR